MLTKPIKKSILQRGRVMSFSRDVKNEIINIFNKMHCNIAEMSALIKYCGKYNKNSSTLIIKSENIGLIDKIIKLADMIFEIKLNIMENNNKQYKLIIANQDMQIISKIINVDKFENNKQLLSRTCCKRAYIRGAFISAGYISNPIKNYHTEFINSLYNQAILLKDTINFFEIDAKIIEKKDNFIVYVKEGEKIVDLLNIIEAHKSLVSLENIRILKDVRNNVNRIVNCETANLNKTVEAGIRQKINIEYIDKNIGIKSLSIQLQEIAILRLENPDISLKELSEMMSNPLTRAGVNHRLNKINEIAERLRGN